MKKMMFVLLLTIIVFSTTFAGEIVDEEIIQFTFQKCKEYNVPADLFFAIGINESGFQNIRSYAPNGDGSYDIGIYQLNSKYIKYYERTFWYKEVDFDPWNPKHNIEIAVIYLKHLYTFTGSWQKAVASYNTGLHGLKKYPESANIYVAKISNALTSIEIFGEDYIYFEE